MINKISEYMNNEMTATWFSNTAQARSSSRAAVTAEIVYYWMIAMGIPMECQYWHFNRLLTLIRVCELKNAQPKKMTKKEILRQNRALNEARKKQYHTKG